MESFTVRREFENLGRRYNTVRKDADSFDRETLRGMMEKDS